MRNIRVFQIGPYPPPFGGVSIHVQRLKEQLEKKNIECIVYDFSRIPKKETGVITLGTTRWKIVPWLLDQLLRKNKNILHFHDIGPALFSLPSLFSIRRKKIIVTLHSFRMDPQKKSLLALLFFWLVRKNNTFFIVVEESIREKLIHLGIKAENISVIPAHISPSLKKSEIDEIPVDLWDFIENHTPLISANASKIFFYNNQDLYGLDMCIDLCFNLKQYYPQIGFVFALQNAGESEYLSIMKRKIATYGITGNFIFQTKPCQFYPIIMKSTIFVRPTNTDGDAISIREALDFGIPCVASDVVTRPENVILFKNRDIYDFTTKVKEVLENYDLYKKRLSIIKSETNNVERIIKVYQRLLNNG